MPRERYFSRAAVTGHFLTISIRNQDLYVLHISTYILDDNPSFLRWQKTPVVPTAQVFAQFQIISVRCFNSTSSVLSQLQYSIPLPSVTWSELKAKSFWRLTPPAKYFTHSRRVHCYIDDSHSESRSKDNQRPVEHRKFHNYFMCENMKIPLEVLGLDFAVSYHFLSSITLNAC